MKSIYNDWLFTFILVHEGNFNISSYNLNIENSNPFGSLQSNDESLDKSHKTLNLSADAQATITCKEMCKTEKLKSDLADANDKLTCQDVTISDLKND